MDRFQKNPALVVENLQTRLARAPSVALEFVPTRYEITMVVAARIEELSRGAHPLINISQRDGPIEFHHIAEAEFAAGLLNFVSRVSVPPTVNGGVAKIIDKPITPHE